MNLKLGQDLIPTTRISIISANVTLKTNEIIKKKKKHEFCTFLMNYYYYVKNLSVLKKEKI